MYGTVIRVKVKPENAAALLSYMDEEDPNSGVSGAMVDGIYKLDGADNDYIIFVVYESKEKYQAFSEDPKTGAAYQEWSKLLDGAPVWHDGDVIQLKIFEE